MTTLIIDIGNTRAKLGLYNGLTLAQPIIISSHDDLINNAIDICQNFQVQSILYSSVAKPKVSQALYNAVKNLGVNCHTFDASSHLPFTIGYNTPSTLGVDRIAAVAGALCEFRGNDLLVIDAGTAITYEYINSDDVYLGGNISPGLQTRFRALHEFTGRLPLCSASDYTSPIGTSTHSAIAAGVLDGLRHEVQGTIDNFLSSTSPLSTLNETFKENEIKKNVNKLVIITGGDHKDLVLKVKSCIFVRPNLVLDGMAYIAQGLFGTEFD